jgi:polysaccharide biosynthesis transport protein
MDTMDRSDSNVPARFPSDAFRTPVPIYAPPRDLATTTTPQIDPRVLLRGLGRHWWRILLLWVVVSTPLAYLIFSLIQPTYEAFSLLQVQPTQKDLFGQGLHDATNQLVAQPYLETQVQLIISDKVLDGALARPATATSPLIAKLPMIAKSKDPKTELRGDMVVEILKNTFLIRVALASRDPQEAAAIVNAVVDSYLERHNEYHRSANKTLKASLDEELHLLDGKIAEKKKELKALVETGHFEVNRRNDVRSTTGKEDDSGIQSALSSVTEDQYTHTTNALLDTELETLEALADLDAAKEQLAKIVVAKQERETHQTNDGLERRIEEEFLNEPEAASLVAQMTEAEDELQDIKSKARMDNDPAKLAAERRIRTLKQKWEKLWRERHDKIEKILLADDRNMQPDVWEEKIVELEIRLEKLKKKKANLAERIKVLEVQHKVGNSETLSATMANQELASLQRMQEIIAQKLEELQFESKHDVYRVTMHDMAQVPKVPANNKRMKFIAIAPVGVMFLVLGLFLMMEVQAQRIGDPDALSTRVQSEVYALPPLPTARSIRKRSATEADDQIEQFIQRLDHVRFAVCGNPSDLAKGRCVLITSAVGREGKTTLAAQLAARCGNAGMSTLLIDADLRRTGLCALLDVPEGPGLGDLLVSDERTPTDLVIPVQGGTFHLLPAGTPIPDPSRALQNRKLGVVITQFRQIYDLVIIDSPPVLPVPDALILGRWADGAVLAVRYDSSRFPQVERARRQLDGAGICILGTVINGMRNSDSYYGSYSYSRRTTPQPDPSAAL